MSKIVINNTTRKVEVHSTGRQGPQGTPGEGLNWRNETWVVGTEYAEHDSLLHDGTSYRAITEHTAALATEPGVGSGWEAAWTVLALGTDVETAAIVAGIADDIETVAARDTDIATVAARDADIGKVAAIDAEVGQVAAIDTDVQAVASVADDVQTLAPAVGDVQTAVANLPAIQAAPQAASDASDARDASQAWATGTEPGGPGTKSAREHALDAANSATAAQNATLIGYGVSIYNENGVDSGGYYAERRATSPSVQTDIYAEIINGDPGSEASIIVMVGGVAVHGPVLVEQGTPVAIDGLSIAVTSTDDLSFMVTASTGVRELFVKLYGAVA